MSIVRVVRLCFLFVIVIGLAGCATFNQEIYDRSFNEIKKKAQNYLDEGKYPQTIFLSKALLDAEPDDDEAQVFIKKALDAKPNLSVLTKKKLLGSNMSNRVHNDDFGWLGKIALYIPNRLLDMIDLITLEVGPSIGVGASAYATKYVAAGAQISAGQAMVGFNRRHLSARATVDDFIEIFPFEARTFMETRAYTGGVYAVTQHSAGLKRPTDKMYQRTRDFWAIGAQAQIPSMGIRLEIHPLEIVDLFAGLAFFDPLNDDLGVSKGFKISRSDRQAMAKLAKQVSRK